MFVEIDEAYQQISFIPYRPLIFSYHALVTKLTVFWFPRVESAHRFNVNFSHNLPILIKALRYNFRQLVGYFVNFLAY